MSSFTICANCGTGEDINLKFCNGCKLVKYCSRDCQVAHRPMHKKACKKRAAEIYEEALFKDHTPPEECPICCLLLPLDPAHSVFKSCCGKMICNGCIYSMVMAEGKNQEERNMCPFCRTPEALGRENDGENLKRVKALMEKGNAVAHAQLAGYYYIGDTVPIDVVKANELWLKAGQLGCTVGYLNLANSYHDGVGVRMDKKKAIHFYELAAMGGNTIARYSLGCYEGQAGNHQRAYKHMIIAAAGGDKDSLEKAKQGFAKGFVTKDEYENARGSIHSIP